MTTDIEHEPANIPASDDQGHNVGLSTRVPASWVRQIEELIKDRNLPYLNKADLVRDAVFKHLKFLTDWGDEPHTSAYYGIVALVQNQLADKTNAEFQKLEGILDKNIKMYIEQGDEEQASKCLRGTLQAMGRMPASFWKTRYIDKIKGKYAKLLVRRTTRVVL